MEVKVPTAQTEQLAVVPTTQTQTTQVEPTTPTAQQTTEQSEITQPTTNKATVEEKVITLIPALFILFAEYLGYVSPYLEWCETLCETGELHKVKLRILTVEADNIKKQMMSEFSIEDIRFYYDLYYDLSLKFWEEKYKNHTNSIIY